MMLAITVSALLTAGALGRASQEDDEKYFYMGEAMRRFGLDYTWDSH